MNDHDSVAGALEQLTYGIYVVTMTDGLDPHAMLATWATQVSFDPPLLAISVEADSVARKMLGSLSSFTLHVLPASGTETAKHVLKHGRLPPARTVSPEAMPQPGSESRHGFLASLMCRVEQQVATGDHVVFIGRVLSAEVGKGAGAALTLHDTGWKYRKRP